LSAELSTDPDGDPLRFTWWQYTDVDTCEAAVDISTRRDDSVASFVVPNEPGKTLHMILEVTDGGDPPLTRYQRVIITVGD